MESQPSPRLEQLSEHQWRLELELDDDAIEAATVARLYELRPKADAPGFRRGKAPLPVLRRVYGARLRREQWLKLAQKEVRRELAERSLRPVAAPQLEPRSDGHGVFATFEIFPELPALDLQALRVRRPRVEIGESDLAYMRARLALASGDGGEEEREELRRVMEEEAAEAAFEEAALEVEAALLAAHPALPLPPSLLAEQIAALRPAGQETRPAAEIEAEATRRLVTALLLTEVARQEGIRVEPAELWRETEKQATAAGEGPEELDRLWGDGAAIQTIEEGLLWRKVVAAVLAKAQVEEVPTSFEALARLRASRPRDVPPPR